MALYSIDEANFVTLHRVEDAAGPPPIPRTQTEVIQRPGVDGTGLLNLGIRGEPFQLRSAVDLLNLSSCYAAIDIYSRMISRGRSVIVWGGVNLYFEMGLLYLVLDVFPTRIRRISAKAGGLTAGATCWLEAQWTLIASGGREE